jgi:beta-lactamase superfamily II metal-dependent hydrolase
MAFEIDFLPVGDGKSGDAIALRFGNLTGPRSEQSIVVIDGGFKESGEQLVTHIKNHYGTDLVDLAISTHPDGDHASGLCVVLEGLRVGQLAMHRPWEHAADIKKLFKDGRITTSGLQNRLEEALQHVSDLETIAIRKNIPIIEPFQGATGFGGKLRVLGPSLLYYQSLLTDFRPMPGVSTAASALSPLRKLLQETVQQIQDFWHIDLLDDDTDTTSAENNTSTILLFEIDGQKLLFTGDAGKTALLNALAYANSLGISLINMRFLQAPHHGSKRNINSKILKQMNATTAYISACAGHEKHPAKKVTNALIKHGAKVFVTRGNQICHNYNGPGRNWGPADVETFHPYVDQ